MNPSSAHLTLERVRWRCLILSEEGRVEVKESLVKDLPELAEAGDISGLVPLAVVMSGRLPVGTVYGWWLNEDPDHPELGRWGTFSGIPEESMSGDPKFESALMDVEIGSYNRAAGMVAAFAAGHDPAAMHDRLIKFERMRAPVLREELAQRHGWLCHICGEQISPRAALYDVHHPSPNFPDVEHVIPIATGGSHWWSNLRLAHHGCNLRKRGRDPSHERDRLAFFAFLGLDPETGEDL